MFTDHKNSKSNLNSFSQQNTIAKGTTFNGDLISERNNFWFLGFDDLHGYK